MKEENTNESVQIIGRIIIEASATLLRFWGISFILTSTQSDKHRTTQKKENKKETE